MSGMVGAAEGRRFVTTSERTGLRNAYDQKFSAQLRRSIKQLLYLRWPPASGPPPFLVTISSRYLYATATSIESSKNASG